MDWWWASLISTPDASRGPSRRASQACRLDRTRTGRHHEAVAQPAATEVVERAARIKRETGIPIACSWNLGLPSVADKVVREGLVDVVLLGRPALANPHWPLWAARELGSVEDPFGLLPQDWAFWLRNFRSHDACIGWPLIEASAVEEVKAA